MNEPFESRFSVQSYYLNHVWRIDEWAIWEQISVQGYYLNHIWCIDEWAIWEQISVQFKSIFANSYTLKASSAKLQPFC